VIFCAKNEDGIPTWKLVLEGKKTVTRRLKPMPIGKEFAIQPGRGKKAVARGKIIGCEKTTYWWWDSLNRLIDEPFYPRRKNWFLVREARKEGFKTWQGLLDWFAEHKININDTYRIEFELVKGKDGT